MRLPDDGEKRGREDCIIESILYIHIQHIGAIHRLGAKSRRCRRLRRHEKIDDSCKFHSTTTYSFSLFAPVIISVSVANERRFCFLNRSISGETSTETKVIYGAQSRFFFVYINSFFSSLSSSL